MFFLLHLFYKSLIHFAEGVHFKENYHSTITFQYSIEEYGPTFRGGRGGPAFSRDGGSIAYSYIDLYNL